MTSPWRNPKIGQRLGSTAYWRKLRRSILLRDRVCWFCKLPLDLRYKDPHPLSPQVHHLVAAPTLNPRDLVACHRKCNFQAGSPGKHDPEPRGMTIW